MLLFQEDGGIDSLLENNFSRIGRDRLDFLISWKGRNSALFTQSSMDRAAVL